MDCTLPEEARLPVLKTILTQSISAAAMLAFLCPASAQTTEPTRFHTIAVASLGADANAAALRERLIDRLNHSGQFKVVDNASASDRKSVV